MTDKNGSFKLQSNLLNIFFIRHGEAEGQGLDADFTDSGIKAFEEENFINEILNINPDIIYSSPVKRAIKTAEKIQGIIITNTGKNVDILKEERFALSSFRNQLKFVSTQDCYEDIIKAYKEILKHNEGKTVLIAAHRETFYPLWEYLQQPKGDILLGEVKSKLKNLEIVRLPS